MQIHNLNDFSGVVDSSYMAVDNGTDTGKVRVGEVTEPIEAEISDLDARLTNLATVITPGSTSGDAEIIDARVVDGVTYPSLHDAINGSYTDLKDWIYDEAQLAYMENDETYFIIPDYAWEIGNVTYGKPTRYDRSRTKGFIPVKAGDVIFIGINGGRVNSINITYYDMTRTSLSVSQWYNLYGDVAVHQIAVAQDGFVRFMLASANISDAYGQVMIKRLKAKASQINRAFNIIESAFSIIKEITISSDMLMLATMSGGVVKVGGNRVVTKTPIPVKKGYLVYQDSIGTERYKYNIAFYDNSMAFVSETGYTMSPYVAPQDGFINIMFVDNTSNTPSTSQFNNIIKILEVDSGENQKSLFVKDEARIRYCSSDNLVIGSYVGGANFVDYRTDRMRLKWMLPANKGDIMQLNLKGVGMNVSMIDKSSRQIVAQSGWRTKSDSLTSDMQGDFVIPMDCYVTAHFYAYDPTTLSAISDLTNLLSNYDGIVSLVHPLTQYGDMIAYHEPKWIARKPIVLKRDIPISQDGCVIDGDLWVFSETGTISIYELDTFELKGTKTFDFGHANCVSYNPINKCLVTYGGNGENQPTAIIYKNPQEADALLKADENCTIINLYNNNTHLSVSGSLCWGEDNQTIYFVDGVYAASSGGQSVQATEYNIYRIQLGMGSVDLSSDGGFGVFVSGVSEDAYNGTCKVLKTFAGEIRNGTDVYSGKHSLATPQGMEYDGYIYLAWGTYGHNFVVIELNDATDKYRVIFNHTYHDYSNSHVETFYEPELLALHGSKIIMGSRTTSGTAKYMLNISERLC